MKGEEAEVRSVENKRRLFPPVLSLAENRSPVPGLKAVCFRSALLLSGCVLNTFALCSC